MTKNIRDKKEITAFLGIEGDKLGKNPEHHSA
jgi:hypothetical protein